MAHKANGHPRFVILLATALNKYHHKTLVSWAGSTDLCLRSTGLILPKAQTQIWNLRMFPDRKPMAGEGMREYEVEMYPESRLKGNMCASKPHAKCGCYPALAAHVRQKALPAKGKARLTTPTWRGLTGMWRCYRASDRDPKTRMCSLTDI